MEITIQELALCDFSKIRQIFHNTLLLTNFVNCTSVENTINIFEHLANRKPKLKIKGIYVAITLFNLGVVFAQRNQPKLFTTEKFRECGRRGEFGERGGCEEIMEKKFFTSHSSHPSHISHSSHTSHPSDTDTLCKKILSEYIEGIGWHDLQYIGFLDFYNGFDLKLHIVFNRITPEEKTIDVKSLGAKSFQYKILEESIKNLVPPEQPEKFLQPTALHSDF